MAVTFALIAYQRHVVARTGSVAIATDRLHYQSDLLLNGSVIAALMLDQYAGLVGADAAFGLLIAAWLLWGAWRSSTRAIDQLMDREWPEAQRSEFLAAAAEYPELAGLHDLRTRTSGSHDFVQFHVWVPGDWTVRDAHDRMDAVEEALQKRFPGNRNPDPPRPRRPYRPRDHAALRPDRESLMTTTPFFQVDAFAERPLGGNPAAVMPLTHWLDDDLMQAIAAENNLSETAFTVPSERDDADYDLRWFTPTVEVELCGHATLAAAHILLSGKMVRFSTRSGILTVTRDGELLQLDLPAAQLKRGR